MRIKSYNTEDSNMIEREQNDEVYHSADSDSDYTDDDE
jgi:hypothetical protein